MDIVVRNIVPNCDTNADGALIKAALTEHLCADRLVTVDFSGINNVTSSFVNTAFLELIEEFGARKFKSVVSVANATKQTADMIKRRVTGQTGKLASVA
ncbi:MAG: STAS-like domain-containing protein [Roseobacter sp.]|uniref:STAS-like domain-containing protein n=1 Tax=Roseibium sp. TaxID=1936156 RepID=UPI003263E63C